MSPLVTKLVEIGKTIMMATLTFGPSVGIGAASYHHPEIVTSIASRLVSFEVGNVKVTLGQEAFRLNKDLSDSNKSIFDQIKLILEVGDLGPREMERLMHYTVSPEDRIGNLNSSCAFPKSNARTRLYALVDEALVNKKLIELREREDLVAGTVHNEFGPAQRCYQALVTKRGADVKSLIVSEMTRSFGRALDVNGKWTEEAGGGIATPAVTRETVSASLRLAGKRVAAR